MGLNRILVARQLVAALGDEPEVKPRESLGFNVWVLTGHTILRT